MTSESKNKIIKNAGFIIFTILFLTGYLFLLEQEKAKRIEKSILDFQTEYKAYLSKDNTVDMTFLEKISKSDFLKSTSLADHFDKLKTDTFKNFKNDYLKQVYEYNFMKNQNTTNFEKSNAATFKAITTESDELVAKLEDNYNISDLSKLKNNKEQLINIVKVELANDKIVLSAFKDAQQNKDTSNDIEDDCFRKQRNILWQYDIETSRKFCYELGFKSCANLFTVSKDSNDRKEPFAGYTLNNPKKLAKNNPYLDYVSLSNNDFRDFDTSVFLRIEDKYTIYPEVYTQEINGRKIYKYNIIALPSSYVLSCSKPK